MLTTPESYMCRLHAFRSASFAGRDSGGRGIGTFFHLSNAIVSFALGSGRRLFLGFCFDLYLCSIPAQSVFLLSVSSVFCLVLVYILILSVLA